MERLIEQFRKHIDCTDTGFLRYLHGKIEWNNRLTAIVGPRGVGKTTMLLQQIKLNHSFDDTLYISADDFYFSENRLFDLASYFNKNGGKYLFIDEIHKYAPWSKELKMMYDNLPDLNVVFTGSSILDIFHGTDDLSRRVLVYYLQGLSFREYLCMTQCIETPAYSLEEIIANKVDVSEIDKPLLHFRNYLREGYYPFYKEPGFLHRLNSIINITLETDIPYFANMNVATSKKLKQLLYIISQSVPFKPNFTKIAESIGLHRNQVADYLHYMERAGIINQLKSVTEGVRLLGKVEKVYLENTNLIYAVGEGSPNIGNIRETFFMNQMKLNHVVRSSEISDFEIDGSVFEIGGKTKTGKQIKSIENAFIVKDDIEYGYMNTIPLWTFGFNY